MTKSGAFAHLCCPMFFVQRALAPQGYVRTSNDGFAEGANLNGELTPLQCGFSSSQLNLGGILGGEPEKNDYISNIIKFPL